MSLCPLCVGLFAVYSTQIWIRRKDYSHGVFFINESKYPLYGLRFAKNQYAYTASLVSRKSFYTWLQWFDVIVVVIAQLYSNYISFAFRLGKKLFKILNFLFVCVILQKSLERLNFFRKIQLFVGQSFSVHFLSLITAVNNKIMIKIYNEEHNTISPEKFCVERGWENRLF